MIDAVEKARILREALPYIRKWSGRTVVTKVGGEIVDDDASLSAFAGDIALMWLVGMKPVIVHGGGRQISESMQKLGKVPRFIGGMRVTDKDTVEVVRDVLFNQINRRLVEALTDHGGTAVSIAGDESKLLEAAPVKGSGGEDLGFVGEVGRVNSHVITGVLDADAIPVIAPLGAGPGGSYNINADLAAGAIAGAVRAEKIVFLTNVPGLYADLGDAGTLISETKADDLEAMLASGSLSEGMIPKIASVVDALRAGVSYAHILDGRIPHAVLLEIFTDRGVGTMILP